MKRFAILLFAVYFLVGCSTGCSKTSTNIIATDFKDQDLITHLNRSVVALIEIKKPNPKDKDDDFNQDHVLRTYCAGVWISSNTFLTAKHCVDDRKDPIFNGKLVFFKTESQTNNNIPVVSTDVVPHVGKVIASHPFIDIAAIMTPEEIEHDIVPLYSDDVNKGQKVHIIGHPQGLEWSYLEGIISAPKRVFDRSEPNSDQVSGQASFIQISSFIWMGNSGGGVFSDNGSLMAITSWLYSGSRQNFHIHIDDIKAFCAEFEIPNVQ